LSTEVVCKPGLNGETDPQPKLTGESMAGSSSAHFSNNDMFGFADILALLLPKAIRELK
jgi:hypothetical protein